MPKTKLDIDQLAVESFAVVAGGTDARGTVRAEEATVGCTFRTNCADTCQLSCTGSCATGLNCQQVC